MNRYVEVVVDKKQFTKLPFGRSVINVKNGFRFVIIKISEIEVEFQEVEYIDMINTAMKTAFIGAEKASAAYMIAAAGIANCFPGVGAIPERLEIETFAIEPMMIDDVPVFHVEQSRITDREQRRIWRNNDSKKGWRK